MKNNNFSIRMESNLVWISGTLVNKERHIVGIHCHDLLSAESLVIWLGRNLTKNSISYQDFIDVVGMAMRRNRELSIEAKAKSLQLGMN